MISDKIRIHKFFGVYEAGFKLLKRFQKKTIFYAKPFLYEKETRLGLVYTQEEYIQELNFLLPLYFQWSSGSAYGSQGQYSIGSKSVELLPSVEPQFAFVSEIKSHFLSGSFVGNLLCLSGGSECIIQNREFFMDAFSKVKADDHTIFTQYNYLVLTGIDFREYSVSAGFYYPIYGIWGNKIFREITSSSSSPIIKLQKTTKDLTLKLIYSRSDIESNTANDDINLINTSELGDYQIMSSDSKQLINNLQMYDLRSQFLRVNVNYNLNKDVNLGFSEVVFQGSYSERYLEKSYELDFLHFTSSLSLKQSFSEYTAIKGEVNYFMKNNSYKLENVKGDSDENKFSFVVSIEFFI